MRRSTGLARVAASAIADQPVVLPAVCMAVAALAASAATLPAHAGTDGGVGGGATLLLWPAGPPEFGDLPGGGPGTTVNVDNLGSGHNAVRRIPGIAPGDFPVPLLRVGHWLVYNGANGAAAIRDDLTGPPRVLGRATFFVRAATPDRVWLVHADRSSSSPVSAQSVSVSSRRSQPALALPKQTAGVIEGSAAGLLLVSRSSELQLWRPGRAPRTLTGLGAAMEGAGFASDARLVAYGSGCRNDQATSGFPHLPVGYIACSRLNVIDVVTRTHTAFAAPAGTAGWVPDGFGVEMAIAPGDRMLAAAAVLPPVGRGRARLFVLRLGHQSKPTPVPSSDSRLYARTAWSPDGAWLFYQGPGVRLRLLDVASGRTYSSRIRCCQYTAMLALKPTR